MSRRLAVHVAVVSLILFGTAVVTSPVTAEEAAPSVAVEPASDLVDGQSVRVAIEGFRPGQRLTVVQCPTAVGPFGCDRDDVLAIPTTEQDGSFELELPLRRFVMGGTVDCASDPCTVEVTQAGPPALVASAPIAFRADPVDLHVTVTPATGLVDGQPVTVAGTGFPPGESVRLRLCRPGAVTLADCLPTMGAAGTPDAAGSFTVEMTVARRLPGGDGLSISTDCAAAACTIATRGGGPVVFAPLVFAAPDPPTAALAVSPPDGLAHRQAVTVTGTGFEPDEYVLVGVCRLGSLQVWQRCEIPMVEGFADASGTFTTELQVSRFVGGWDCVVGGCVVDAFLDGTGTARHVEAPIHFAETPVATLEVSRTEGLADDELVRATGTGYQAGRSTYLEQCPPDPPSRQADCLPVGYGHADYVEGAIDAEVRVVRVLRPANGPPVDCAVEVCTIGVRYGYPFPVADPVPIAFAHPALDVAVRPHATLRAGTGEVVAQVVVSCDVATPVSLTATFAQPPTDAGHELEDQPCTPDEPLLAFVTVRVPPGEEHRFVLGTATLSVSALPSHRAEVEGSPLARAEVTDVVELVDHDAAKAGVDELLADPANVEVRDAVLEAIRSRVRQDPVFRAEWRAAVGT